MNSIPLIKSNPYQLTEINGIGFVSADVYARRLGFDENSPERASCPDLHVGATSPKRTPCFPRQELIEKTVEELHIKQEVVEDALEVLTEERLVKVLEPAKTQLSILKCWPGHVFILPSRGLSKTFSVDR